MSELRGQRVLVVGLAASGFAAARALSAGGAIVRVSEERPEPAEAIELRSRGVEVLAGGHAPEHLDGIDLVVTSPGVPERAPILSWAADRGLPIWSELELGWRSVAVPAIAVTGTNGKSTTTELCASILRAAGLDAIACGNIGHPLSTAARERRDALAIEASSFQLRFIDAFAPRVSVLTNLAPDHLDWHGSFEAYVESKARIFEKQGRDDVHVGNRDDEAAAVTSKGAPCHVVWFGMGAPGDGEVGAVGDALIARLDREVRIELPPGRTAAFREDAAAAAAATLAFGIGPEAVGEGIRTMRSLPHRGEVVARARGVSFVDDSKATNVHAALTALRDRERVVLIAGGAAKGVDLGPLRAAAPALAGVIAIGEAAPHLVEVFDGLVPVRIERSIERATRAAFELAPPEGTVLLAPACASWDQFRDYTERGERFSAQAAAIAREVGG